MHYEDNNNYPDEYHYYERHYSEKIRTHELATSTTYTITHHKYASNGDLEKIEAHSAT